MGPLTESMQRLCGEIVALRGTRLSFVRDLGQDVASQLAAFHQARADMARETKADRQNFVRALATEVADMRAGFRRSHREMARQTKEDRQAAVTHLKKSLEAWRHDFASDLAGAHRIWFGPSPDELRTEKDRRQQAEAAQKAREAAAARERQIAQIMVAAEGHEVKEESQVHRPGKKKG